jgi:hypothetical protein
MNLENNKGITTKVSVNTNEQLSARNKSNEQLFSVHPIHLSRGEINKEGTSYYSLENLGNTKSVQLEIDGEPVVLSEEMYKKLAEFLKISKDLPKNFDCGSFAKLLNLLEYNIDSGYAEKYDVNKFDIQRLDKITIKELNPGDTIFLSLSTNPANYMFKHFAIYIGKDLYISKFGGAGKLIVTDLVNMANGFGGVYVFKISAKKPQ